MTASLHIEAEQDTRCPSRNDVTGIPLVLLVAYIQHLHHVLNMVLKELSSMLTRDDRLTDTPDAIPQLTTHRLSLRPSAQALRPQAYEHYDGCWRSEYTVTHL